MTAAVSPRSRVRLTIDHPVALQDGRAPNRLREMTFAGARRSEKQRVLAPGNKACGGEVVDERAIHLLVEIKVKGVERALRVAKAIELVPTLEQTVRPPAEFVADERGDEIDGRQLLGLRLLQPRVEDCGHAGEPELPKGAISSMRFMTGLLSCDR